MRTRTLAAGIVAGLTLFTGACGSGDSDSASSDGDGGARRVDVAMVDIDFKPKTIEVTKGEEVQFTFTNDGKIRHEAYIGTPDHQADHAKEMAEGDKDSDRHNDGHGGDDSRNDKITVDPSESGELTYRFDDVGTFEIGCHEPGHYAAGMKITVNVT